MDNWLNKIRSLVESSSNAQVGGGVSEAEVSEAERLLGIHFPTQLRAYLLQLGFLNVAHYEFYGLGEGLPKYLDIVLETLAERHEFRPYLPKHLIPIQNNGAGDHYCLDLSSSMDDPPVVFWSHEEDESQTPEPEGECFSLWLLEHVVENVA
jgi:hypothetical protein